MKKLAWLKTMLFSTVCVMGCGTVYATAPVSSVTKTAQERPGVWSTRSDHSYFFVKIYTPAAIVSGQDQRWHVRVVDSRGAPMPVALSVVATIPGKAGSPVFTPNLTSLGNGMFDLRNVNFRKTGRWMVQFQMKNANFQDNASMIFDVRS